MNRYTFDECYVGMYESFMTDVSESKMQEFLDITGDVNPLHNNADYAKLQGFDDRVVYGLLTTSFFSTLAGVYLPGERCLIQEVDYKYVKPVYVGDKLNVSGEVVEKDDRTRQLRLKVRIKRVSDDATVVRGAMTVGVLTD